MNEGPQGFIRIAQPIKGLAQRFAYIGLIVAAFALMMLGKVDIVLVERARTTITDTVAPILDIVSAPVTSATAFIHRVEGLWGMHAENQILRENNERLMQWQALARKLEAENKALQKLLNYVPDLSVGYISARVIADTGGAFAHSLLLNAGKRDGVQKGQAAVTGEGLVGRIAGVGARSSRILLITDLNSRIPVVVGPNRTRAILTGDNSDRPRIIHLPPGETLSPGDEVTTSGHGGVLPVGLAVGVVATVNENGASVEPYVERDKLELIRVVDFGLSGILRKQVIEETPVSATYPEVQAVSEEKTGAGEVSSEQ
ncbi:MAG: rod shape-determining protein MreC [Rhodospirillales bacterium]|jgi:rod shape-determining protein MreC|nr:rod shape-determining protein MreC [Rhodospirillales bacterium]